MWLFFAYCLCLNLLVDYDKWYVKQRTWWRQIVKLLYRLSSILYCGGLFGYFVCGRKSVHAKRDKWVMRAIHMNIPCVLSVDWWRPSVLCLFTRLLSLKRDLIFCNLIGFVYNRVWCQLRNRKDYIGTHLIAVRSYFRMSKVNLVHQVSHLCNVFY